MCLFYRISSLWKSPNRKTLTLKCPTLFWMESALSVKVGQVVPCLNNTLTNPNCTSHFKSIITQLRSSDTVLLYTSMLKLHQGKMWKKKKSQLYSLKWCTICHGNYSFLRFHQKSLKIDEYINLLLHINELMYKSCYCINERLSCGQLSQILITQCLLKELYVHKLHFLYHTAYLHESVRVNSSNTSGCTTLSQLKKLF